MRVLLGARTHEHVHTAGRDTQDGIVEEETTGLELPAGGGGGRRKGWPGDLLPGKDAARRGRGKATEAARENPPHQGKEKSREERSVSSLQFVKALRRKAPLQNKSNLASASNSPPYVAARKVIRKAVAAITPAPKLLRHLGASLVPFAEDGEEGVEEVNNVGRGSESGIISALGYRRGAGGRKGTQKVATDAEREEFKFLHECPPVGTVPFNNNLYYFNDLRTWPSPPLFHIVGPAETGLAFRPVKARPRIDAFSFAPRAWRAALITASLTLGNQE
ncbi:hypothetical protein KM043_008126 [Ampulex compressa]|nr:hypothetical protein KM043_008126 [Ampulex compressa]